MRKLTFWSILAFVAVSACPALAAVDLVTLPIQFPWERKTSRSAAMPER